MPQKKKAVALKYNLEQDVAPVVIASGYGEVAERIINIAEERGIPVYRDDSAASMLCMLEVGASIPEDLYQIVATIYIQIMETANRIKEGTLSMAGPAAGTSARRSGGRIFTPLDTLMEQPGTAADDADDGVAGDDADGEADGAAEGSARNAAPEEGSAL
jgi:flagellar biosynthesis protein